MRAMVQYYAVLAFPLAALISFSLKRWLSAVIALSIGVFFLLLNLFQTGQYRRNMIHWDGMTKEAYWFSITHPKFQKQDWKTFESYIQRPDYDAAKKGITVKDVPLNPSGH